MPHELSGAWKNAAAKDPLQQHFGWVSTALPGDDLWRVIRRGKATTWTVRFNMDRAPRGQATLRVALAGADGGSGLAVAVNGHDVGTLYPMRTSAIQYNTDKSVWQELKQPFDAKLLKEGENEMRLTVPAGEVTTGVVYDYLRLELDESANSRTTP